MRYKIYHSPLHLKNDTIQEIKFPRKREKLFFNLIDNIID